MRTTKPSSSSRIAIWHDSRELSPPRRQSSACSPPASPAPGCRSCRATPDRHKRDRWRRRTRRRNRHRCRDVVVDRTAHHREARRHLDRMLGAVIFDIGDLGHRHPYSGSQENASPERSSGMNEGLSAGKACSAIASGVQPVALCRLRIGRGELKRYLVHPRPEDLAGHLARRVSKRETPPSARSCRGSSAGSWRRAPAPPRCVPGSTGSSGSTPRATDSSSAR